MAAMARKQMLMAEAQNFARSCVEISKILDEKISMEEQGLLYIQQTMRRF